MYTHDSASTGAGMRAKSEYRLPNHDHCASPLSAPSFHVYSVIVAETMAHLRSDIGLPLKCCVSESATTTG